MRRTSWLLVLGLLGAPAPSPAAEEGKDDDIPTQDLRAGKDEKKRYLLHGPRKGAVDPKEGWRLLVAMPGGDGSADFQGFVKDILRNALSDEFLVAQPVSVKWTEGQEVVWPVKLNPAPKMQFTTEEFVDAVIADVAKGRKVDAGRVFTLSWSSSGPAAYAVALREKTPVTGSYVAMSVFFPSNLPPLKNGRGRAFFLDHSPGDTVCRFTFAEKARDELKKNGALVEFSTYEGGHGWQGDVFGRLRKGFEFLERNRAKSPAK